MVSTIGNRYLYSSGKNIGCNVNSVVNFPLTQKPRITYITNNVMYAGKVLTTY